MPKDLKTFFQEVRLHTEAICSSLKTEDYSVQPMVDVSPPKWHLAHSTWFFEQFILVPYAKDYQVFDADFAYLFNSYYNTVGERVLRPNRGNMTRPEVAEVYAYRAHVTQKIVAFLATDPSLKIQQLIELGLNHEQQHQELLVYDIKFILGNQPTFPKYTPLYTIEPENCKLNFTQIEEGTYEIGYKGNEFCFDNELNAHKVYLQSFEIANKLVTNGEFIEFIEAGGYTNFNHWHADGWDYIKENDISAPLYWHKVANEWKTYHFKGLQKVETDLPVMNISFYEAAAFADWKDLRLPTEFEWEVASNQFKWGQLWEWTNSAYLPYPGFAKAPGAIGEYNGKFMINQMVLRGASIATPTGHSRSSYRNFFHPSTRWQFNGIRLAK